MRRKASTILVSIVMVVGLCNFVPVSHADMLDEVKLYARALQAILEGYVELPEPRKLFYGAVQGMIATFNDPFSEFIEPEKYELMTISMEGEYAGIGIKIDQLDGFVIAGEVQPSSPAERAGILQNDRILEADGIVLRNMDLPAVASMLRGEAGVELKLLVFRPELNQEMMVNVMRETIEIDAINDIRIVGRAVGYFRVDDFQGHSTDQFNTALDRLIEDGAESFVIDLRGNNGGLMPQAISMADRFLPEGKLIVAVESRLPEQRHEHYSTESWLGKKYPTVILIDEASASASEIFASALRDQGVALLVGQKSFGKGSVQSVVPLDEHSAMKITTARYRTPAGRLIDHVGITPDYIVKRFDPTSPNSDQQIRQALALLPEYF